MSALSVDSRAAIEEILGDGMRFSAIEEARDLYLEHLSLSNRLPNKREVEAELKSVRDAAEVASEALKELDRKLDRLSVSGRFAIRKSAGAGAPLQLKNTLLSLAHLTMTKYPFPTRTGGRASKWERSEFIRSLATIFECATGIQATVATRTNERGGDGYGLFHDFVFACAGDLAGFLEAENSAITSAIRRALKVTERYKTGGF